MIGSEILIESNIMKTLIQLSVATGVVLAIAACTTVETRRDPVAPAVSTTTTTTQRSTVQHPTSTTETQTTRSY